MWPFLHTAALRIAFHPSVIILHVILCVINEKKTSANNVLLGQKKLSTKIPICLLLPIPSCVRKERRTSWRVLW